MNICKTLFYCKCIVFIVVLLVGFKGYSQSIALRSNALFYISGTTNLGVEYALSNKSSIDLNYYHKYWGYESIGRFRYYLIQSEIKKWECRKFVGRYWGIHTLFSEYNIGGIDAFNLKDYRYQGKAYGLGVSFGYGFIVSSRLNIDVGIGFGYTKYVYEKFNCEHCGDLIKEEVLDCIAPTKAGVSLVYLIK